MRRIKIFKSHNFLYFRLIFLVYIVECYSFVIKMDYSKLNFLLNGIARSSHLLTKKAACVYLMRKNLGYKDKLQDFLYERVATMIELIESNESLMSLIKQGSDSDIEYFSHNYIPNSFDNEPWNFIKKYVLKYSLRTIRFDVLPPYEMLSALLDDDFSLFFKIGCLEDLLSLVSYPKWNKIHLMANEFQEVLDQEVLDQSNTNFDLDVKFVTFFQDELKNNLRVNAENVVLVVDKSLMGFKYNNPDIANIQGYNFRKAIYYHCDYNVIVEKGAFCYVIHDANLPFDKIYFKYNAQTLAIEQKDDSMLSYGLTKTLTSANYSSVHMFHYMAFYSLLPSIFTLPSFLEPILFDELKQRVKIGCVQQVKTRNLKNRKRMKRNYLDINFDDQFALDKLSSWSDVGVKITLIDSFKYLNQESTNVCVFDAYFNKVDFNKIKEGIYFQVEYNASKNFEFVPVLVSLYGRVIFNYLHEQSLYLNPIQLFYVIKSLKLPTVLCKENTYGRALVLAVSGKHKKMASSLYLKERVRGILDEPKKGDNNILYEVMKNLCNSGILKNFGNKYAWNISDKLNVAKSLLRGFLFFYFAYKYNMFINNEPNFLVKKSFVHNFRASVIDMFFVDYSEDKAKIDTQYFRKKIITMIEKNPQKTFDQIVLDMFDLYNMQIKIILKDIPEIMKKP